MEFYNCKNGCCNIKIKPYASSKNPYEKIKRRRRKAGVFMYDPNSEKILLIQSRGHLWGPPKGTLNYGESERVCAVRELREETGILVHFDDFKKAMNIYNRAIYFYTEKTECEVNVQSDTEDNDANGICWIKISCLEECIENGNISITQHCRLSLNKFLGKTLPHSRFRIVGERKISSRF